MKKICFITSARSEYGLIKWLMKDIEASDCFKLQLIVTGGHLLKEQGYTIDNILEDDFTIDATVDVQLNTESVTTIAASMGILANQLSVVISKLKPDYIVVLGDRYELLPICNTAYIMQIPIIHISGGDITDGAIDNGIRNAVTMLADYHFPGTKESADNIIRMRNSNENIWCVGEPGLDSFNRNNLISFENISEDLQLNPQKKWVLMTFHPETKKTLDYNLDAVRTCCKCLLENPDIQTLATYANADYGGDQINTILEEVSANNPDRFCVVSSLGNLRYLSLMKYVFFIIGNSSSGIIEAPFLKKHVINIGDRQRGRHMCSNITCCSTEYDAIKHAIENVMNTDVNISDTDHWGDGHTSERIITILKETLCRE